MFLCLKLYIIYRMGHLQLLKIGLTQKDLFQFIHPEHKYFAVSLVLGQYTTIYYLLKKPLKVHPKEQ